MTVTGAHHFALKISRRVNFLRERGIRELLQDMGKDIAEQYRANVRSFTPGAARDLSPNYKREKQRRVGFVYPILIATGAMLAALRTRVYRGPPWRIAVWFTGQHPGGRSNADLAEHHRSTGRDFTRRKEGWSKKWLKELGERLRRER